jgi:hypothetical protein
MDAAERRRIGQTMPSDSIATRDYSNVTFGRSDFATDRYSGRTYGGGGTVHVRGYTRKDGTYVRPHTRSAPRGRR